MPHNPNSELVAVALIRSFAIGPSASFGVGTTLPENKDSWIDGFVQVQVVGGSSDPAFPERSPLIQVDCWVPSINSSKPQWGKANTIAEDIFEHIYDNPNIGVNLSLGPNFKAATVQTVFPAGEIRRVNNDPAGHARYTFDIQMNWVAY